MMIDMAKQIYVSIEIADSELRLICAEYFNTRFNIIKVMKEPLFGLRSFVMEDENACVESIKNLKVEAEKQIGTSIENVILVLPSIGFKKSSLKVSVPVKSGVVDRSDVREALRYASGTKIDSEHILVNVAPSKYTVNGISYRKMPLKEVGRELTVDTELITLDKDVVYRLVTLIEKSGMHVLDVTDDLFAISKEAQLLEQSVDQNVVLIKSDNHMTSFGLFSKGKMIAAEVVRHGIYDLLEPLAQAYHLQRSVLIKLLLNCVEMDKEKINDDPIYIFSKDKEKIVITTNELYMILRKPMSEYVRRIAEVCTPILENNPNVKFVIVGEGSKCDALVSMLNLVFEKDVEVYDSKTIGAKDSSMYACLGSFYGFKDNADISGNKKVSVDLLAFDQLMNKQIVDEDGESLTSKIKLIFTKERGK